MYAGDQYIHGHGKMLVLRNVYERGIITNPKLDSFALEGQIRTRKIAANNLKL